MTMLDPVFSETQTPVHVSRPLCNLYLHAQIKPFVTSNIEIPCPHVQVYQLESDPSQVLQKGLSVGFWDGSIETDDDLGDSEDGLGEFDQCHKTRLVST